MCTDYIAYGSIGAASTVGLHAYMACFIRKMWFVDCSYMYRLRLLVVYAYIVHVQLSMVKTNYWKI